MGFMIVGGGAGNGAAQEVTAESDWQARISGSDVVWYHDFRSDAEVDAYRWAGTYGADPQDLFQPGKVARYVGDGITQNCCLQIQLPTDQKLQSQWWRPFSPMLAGDNGKATDDPGASASITARAWDPPQASTNYKEGWAYGNYAHADYAGLGEAKDGTDYYFQVRVKLDPEFTNSPTGNVGGKLLYFTRVEVSLTAQEIVPSLQEGPHLFQMYHAGSMGLDNLNYTWTDPPPGQSPNCYQPGSQYGLASCDYPNLSNADNCWIYPYDEWFTLLFHIIPGHENDRPGPNVGEDTGIEVWAARSGETTYTKIWERLNYAFDFTNAYGQYNGWNALILSNWHNNWAGGTPLWVRFDQAIFSKSTIPCPLV